MIGVPGSGTAGAPWFHTLADVLLSASAPSAPLCPCLALAATQTAAVKRRVACYHNNSPSPSPNNNIGASPSGSASPGSSRDAGPGSRRQGRAIAITTRWDRGAVLSPPPQVDKATWDWIPEPLSLSLSAAASPACCPARVRQWVLPAWA